MINNNNSLFESLKKTACHNRQTVSRGAKLGRAQLVTVSGVAFAKLDPSQDAHQGN